MASLATNNPEIGAVDLYAATVEPNIIAPFSNRPAPADEAEESFSTQSSNTSSDFTRDNKSKLASGPMNMSSMMAFGLFAAKNADDQDTISSSSLTNFVDSLEAAGLDMNPLKKAIETATGKTYAEIAANADRGERFQVGDFYSQDESGARVPRMSNSGFNSLRACSIAQSDNAGGGYCAKGTANVLESMGMRVTRGNATNWDQTLPQNGWVRLRGANAQNAPEGAVLVFNNDLEAGKGRNDNGHGAQYGHVEIVGENANGKRVYISDAVRNNAGGSVPNNFSGAYIYVGPNAPQSNLAIADRFNNPSQHASRTPSFGLAPA